MRMELAVLKRECELKTDMMKKEEGRFQEALDREKELKEIYKEALGVMRELRALSMRNDRHFRFEGCCIC